MKIKVYLKSGVTIDFDYERMDHKVFQEDVEALEMFNDGIITLLTLDDGEHEVTFKTSQIAAYEVIR